VPYGITIERDCFGTSIKLTDDKYIRNKYGIELHYIPRNQYIVNLEQNRIKRYFK
jgi:hypothetical protein